jgi:ubiquinone/menaquinone biosynthesis C-methylase UbiE
MHQQPVYNTIGKTYDTTRKPDPEIVQSLKQALRHTPSGRYLDIGCGTGNYTGALAQAGLNIEGIDISNTMLTKARDKFPKIQFHKTDARRLDMPDAEFDGATCILATHHINNNKQLFNETYRILKSGYFVIFTATPEQMVWYWLNHYFPALMQRSIEKMASFKELHSDLTAAGFSDIQQTPFFITNALQDWFLHAGKYRPEIYLEQSVRKGISSFHLTDNHEEIEQGLARLATDIQSIR